MVASGAQHAHRRVSRCDATSRCALAEQFYASRSAVPQSARGRAALGSIFAKPPSWYVTEGPVVQAEARHFLFGRRWRCSLPFSPFHFHWRTGAGTATARSLSGRVEQAMLGREQGSARTTVPRGQVARPGRPSAPTTSRTAVTTPRRRGPLAGCRRPSLAQSAPDPSRRRPPRPCGLPSVQTCPSRPLLLLGSCSRFDWTWRRFSFRDEAKTTTRVRRMVRQLV